VPQQRCYSVAIVSGLYTCRESLLSVHSLLIEYIDLFGWNVECISRKWAALSIINSYKPSMWGWQGGRGRVAVAMDWTGDRWVSMKPACHWTQIDTIQYDILRVLKSWHGTSTALHRVIHTKWKLIGSLWGEINCVFYFYNFTSQQAGKFAKP